MLTLPKHNRYDYSVIGERKDYSWPGGKRLAFCTTTNIEVYAYRKGTGWDPAKKGEPQQQRNYSWRDYGNRVGIWRLFDMFEQFKLPAAHNINSLLYEYHPQITDKIRARGDEVVGHGRTNAERQGDLWELDEKRLIDDVTQEMTKREASRRRAGWPGRGREQCHDRSLERGRLQIRDGLAADDQPFWLKTRSGPILSVPYPAELNDSASIIHRENTASQFADMIVDQFDEMVEQCAAQPLVMTLSLHPFVVGQPFRLPSLRKALKHCVEHAKRDRVWWTTPGQVADHCYALPPGTIRAKGPDNRLLRPAAARSIVAQNPQLKEDHTWLNHCPSARSAKAASTARLSGSAACRFPACTAVRGRRRRRADPRSARPGHHHARFVGRLRQGPERDAGRQCDQGPPFERGAGHQVRQSRRRRRQICRWPAGVRCEFMRGEPEASRRRCDRSLLRAPHRHDRSDRRHVGAMARLVQQGKVRALG